jgi:hypothetical protein
LPTQYGKSLAVAIGVLLRTTSHKEKWAIIAPTEEKGRIIMDYIIEHIFDVPEYVQMLDYNGSKEKLMQERSKTRITFRDHGEVRVYTADANNMKNVEKALAGFGAPNIIIDESAILPDKVYAMIKRMAGGTQDNFILEIGNPFFKNHFWRMWTGKRYIKVFVDWVKALAEGRYTEDFIAEMQEEPLFDVLYGCMFPEEEQAPEGYRRLISDSFIYNAMINNDLPLGHNEKGELIDQPILGIDPNHGGSNFTVMVLRYPLTGFAKIVLRKQYAEDKEDITGEIIADAERIIDEYEVGDGRIAVDAGGVGAGVADGLKRKGYEVEAILFGQSPVMPFEIDPNSKAKNTTRYANMKARLFWALRVWIRANNGKLVKHDGFFELKEVNYKENTSSKVQMESKQELSKRGVASPDCADALALTFIPVRIDNGDDIAIM